jgi:transposase, IS5 family
MTRIVLNPQMTFGQIDITKIELDPKSRDDIPQILKGLQHIYSDVITREKLFQLLQKEIAPKVSKNTGRPGMELWKLLVLGCLRVNLNLDYDKLHELANKHLNIRQMLGHSENTFGERYYYELQTLKDNIKLMTPELLDQVNQIVVESGYRLIKKKERGTFAWTV